MIDICLCTHSPHKEILVRVVQAISKQTAKRDSFRVLIVDNASETPLRLSDFPFSLLRDAGISHQLLREPRLGIAYARSRALRASKAEAVLFVDDDNILDKNFVRRTLKILREHPEVGCFSGKILWPKDLDVPKWVLPLSSSLAIRDIGDKPHIDWFTGKWQPWVPACTASMVVRKEVAEQFLRKHASRASYYGFGRKGRGNLMSGEDFLIAMSAADAGFKCGYFPELEMHHFVRSDRFRVPYFAKLMHSYAKTQIRHERYLELPPEPFAKNELRHRLLALDFKGEDPRARLCYWIYQFVYTRDRYLRLLEKSAPVFYGQQ